MATSGASLSPIYERLSSVGSYHPFSADTFSDWSMEAGDYITISRDGESYKSPVHTSRLSWKGQSQVSVSSDGSEARENIAKQTQRKYNKGNSGLRNSRHLKQELLDAYNGLSSFFEVTASRLYARFQGLYDGLVGWFEITRSRMRAEFWGAYDGLKGEFEVTRSRMRADFYGMYDGLKGSFEVTRSRMRTEFLGVYDGLKGEFEVTRSRMRAEFQSAYDGLSSTFEVTRSRMKTDFKGAYDGLSSIFEVTRSRMAANFKGYYDGLSSEFRVTRSKLSADFQSAYDGMSSAFEVTRSRMAADFQGKYDGLSSHFEVTRSSFNVSIQNYYDQLSSGITASARSLETYVNGKTSKASILLAINGSGKSTTKIEADQITIQGNDAVVLSDVLTIDTSGSDSIVRFKTDKIRVGTNATNLVTLTDGVLTLTEYRYKDLTDRTVKPLLMNASVDGNTLKIWKFGDAANSPSITFNKAVSLSGAWDGNRKFSFGESLHNQTRYTTIVSSVPKSDISWSGKSGTATLKATIGDSESTVVVGTVNVNGDVPYENGWSGARNSVVGKTYTVNSTNYNYFPTTAPSTKLQYMKCCQPNSTSGNTNVSAYTYYITSDNDYAYIRYGNTSGPIVAQYNHGKYTAGYNANNTAYATVTKASLSPGESSTISVYFKNAAGSTQNTGRTYTVSARALNLKVSTFESAAAKQTFYVPSGYDGYGTITINAFDLSGYKTNAAYEAYGNSRYAAGSPVSGTVGSHRSAQTWTFNIKKGDQTTTSLAIDCANIYTAARSGYYSSSQYSTAVNNARESGWSKGYSDGSPISGYVSSHRTTTVWTFQINKGDNTTTILAIDCASIYTAARSGYYTQAEYNERFNAGWYAYYDSSYWEIPSSSNGYACKVPARNEYAKVTWFYIKDRIGIWADDFALLGQQASGDAINAFKSGCYQLVNVGYVSNGYYYKFSISAGGKKVWYWFKAG